MLGHRQPQLSVGVSSALCDADQDRHLHERCQLPMGEIAPVADALDETGIRFPAVVARLGGDTYAFIESWLGSLEAEYKPARSRGPSHTPEQQTTPQRPEHAHTNRIREPTPTTTHSRLIPEQRLHETRVRSKSPSNPGWLRWNACDTIGWLAIFVAPEYGVGVIGNLGLKSVCG
jgi:hypothetical protein